MRCCPSRKVLLQELNCLGFLYQFRIPHELWCDCHWQSFILIRCAEHHPHPPRLSTGGAVRKRSVIANQRARWCGTPRVFPSGTIPRIFKHLGRKTKLFPSNRGAATPVTSVTGSQRHTFLTAPRFSYCASTVMPCSAKYLAAPLWKGAVMPEVALSRLSSAPLPFSLAMSAALSKMALVRL